MFSVDKEHPERPHRAVTTNNPPPEREGGGDHVLVRPAPRPWPGAWYLRRAGYGFPPRTGGRALALDDYPVSAKRQVLCVKDAAFRSDRNRDRLGGVIPRHNVPNFAVLE